MTVNAADLAPTVLFRGGPDGLDNPKVIAYTPPRNTEDPRYAACAAHRVACDCREAEIAEWAWEQRDEWRILGNAGASALVGHQVQPPMGLTDWQRRKFEVCLCSGCVIQRASGNLLPRRAIDLATGRVRPTAPAERSERQWPR